VSERVQSRIPYDALPARDGWVLEQVAALERRTLAQIEGLAVRLGDVGRSVMGLEGDVKLLMEADARTCRRIDKLESVIKATGDGPAVLAERLDKLEVLVNASSDAAEQRDILEERLNKVCDNTDSRLRSVGDTLVEFRKAISRLETDVSSTANALQPLGNRVCQLETSGAETQRRIGELSSSIHGHATRHAGVAKAMEVSARDLELRVCDRLNAFHNKVGPLERLVILTDTRVRNLEKEHEDLRGRVLTDDERLQALERLEGFPVDDDEGDDEDGDVFGNPTYHELKRENERLRKENAMLHDANDILRRDTQGMLSQLHAVSRALKGET
jgi:chromosome segregation ATPase